MGVSKGLTNLFKTNLNYILSGSFFHFDYSLHFCSYLSGRLAQNGNNQQNMQLKNLENPFNFDTLLKSHLRKGKLQKAITCEFPPKPRVEKSTKKGQGYTYISHASNLIAFHETERQLIYCFCHVSKVGKYFEPEGQYMAPAYWQSHSKHVESHKAKTSFEKQKKEQFQTTATAYFFNKASARYQTYEFKPLEGKVTTVNFLYGSQRNECSLQLYLVFGTNSGVLRVLSFQQNNSIFISSMQCSNFRIHQIVQSPWLNTCILLLQNQSILFVNFIEKVVVVEMSGMVIPLDNPLSIKLHHSHQFLLSSSRYGTMRLWRVGEDAVAAIFSHKKAFYIRPSFSTSALSPHGLLWCDFIGDFFAFITVNNKSKTKFLKIVAFSVTILNEAEENYQTISSFEVTSMQSQEVSHIENYPEKRAIILCKRMRKSSILEIYRYNQFYQINCVISIDISTHRIHQFRLSRNMEYIMLRESWGFHIGNQKTIFTEAMIRHIEVQNLEFQEMFAEKDTAPQEDF